MNRVMTVVMSAALLLTSGLGVNAEEFDLQTADLSDRMTYHRTIDAAVWAMKRICDQYTVIQA
jgi:hypothetical protein